MRILHTVDAVVGVSRWVGLLARGVAAMVSCRPLHLPRLDAEWSTKRRARTYSGGTAPDLHRTSLLCPSWAPKRTTFVSFARGRGQEWHCRKTGGGDEHCRNRAT